MTPTPAWVYSGSPATARAPGPPAQVLQDAGYTPSYVMHATLLMPGEVSATLYNPITS
jgi:hypothetical protein